MKKLFLSVSLFFILFTSALVKTSNAQSWFFIKNAASSFSPTSLTGLKFWVKDTISGSDGDAVSSWADQSGLGNNLTAVNNATLKTNIKNTRSVVRFDGTNDAMDTSTALTSIISLSSFSAWFVVNMKAFNSNFTSAYYPNEAIWTEKNGGNMGLYGLSGGPLFGLESYGGATFKVSTSTAADTWKIVHMRHESGNLYISTNGGTESSIANSDFYGGTNVMRIGCNYDTPAAGTCAQVDIGEIVISNVAESGSNLTSMQTYLNGRWAVY